MNLLQKINTLGAEIAELKTQQLELCNQYAKENALYKVGDFVNVGSLHSDTIEILKIRRVIYDVHQGIIYYCSAPDNELKNSVRVSEKKKQRVCICEYFIISRNTAIKAMTAQEVKQAVEVGKTVHWSDENYVVIKNKRGDFFIKCIPNGHCIGLTHGDGVTLNGQADKFYIAEA